MKKVIIGSRGSILALCQANFIKDMLENKFDLSCEIRIVKTTGDKILDAPLAKIGGKGLFTKELEELILKKEITIAVHSLKDVPVSLADGLIISAITKREDRRDCFLSKKYSSIYELPYHARVGTTSLRRSMQLKRIRSDIDSINLRGNIQTRLDKLKNDNFDAIILANAGINRLGIKNTDINHILPLDINIMIPAMGQGALAIECRDDCDILDKLVLLNDNTTSIECSFEREFIKILDGGCQMPIGVSAITNGNIIEMKCILGLPNGEEVIIDNIKGVSSDNLAYSLYEKVERSGARELLQKALLMIDSIIDRN